MPEQRYFYYVLVDGGARSPPREARAFSPHFQLSHASPTQQLAMQQLFAVEEETSRGLIARPLSPGIDYINSQNYCRLSKCSSSTSTSTLDTPKIVFNRLELQVRR